MLNARSRSCKPTILAAVRMLIDSGVWSPVHTLLKGCRIILSYCVSSSAHCRSCRAHSTCSIPQSAHVSLCTVKECFSMSAMYQYIISWVWRALLSLNHVRRCVYSLCPLFSLQVAKREIQECSRLKLADAFPRRTVPASLSLDLQTAQPQDDGLLGSDGHHKLGRVNRFVSEQTMIDGLHIRWISFHKVSFAGRALPNVQSNTLTGTTGVFLSCHIVASAVSCRLTRRVVAWLCDTTWCRATMRRGIRGTKRIFGMCCFSAFWLLCFLPHAGCHYRAMAQTRSHARSCRLFWAGSNWLMRNPCFYSWNCCQNRPHARSCMHSGCLKNKILFHHWGCCCARAPAQSCNPVRADSD